MQFFLHCIDILQLQLLLLIVTISNYYILFKLQVFQLNNEFNALDILNENCSFFLYETNFIASYYITFINPMTVFYIILNYIVYVLILYLTIFSQAHTT